MRFSAREGADAAGHSKVKARGLSESAEYGRHSVTGRDIPMVAQA